MNTVVINSKNIKTSYPHGLLLNLTEKIDLRRDEKTVALPSLGIYYTWKNIESLYYYKNNKFNQMVHIL